MKKKHLIVQTMCRKELRNKFNGKLVMRWTGFGPGPIIAQTIEDFYNHIEMTYHISYIEYIRTKKPKEVRVEFFKFIDPISEQFGSTPF